MQSFQHQLGFYQNKIGSDCVLNVTRADYYNKPELYPQFLASPLSYYKEMSLGGIDFANKGLRKIENGTIFKSMDNDYTCCGTGPPAFPYDSHSRYELINNGDMKDFRNLYYAPFSKEVLH
jgi:hypothetical protein